MTRFALAVVLLVACATSGSAQRFTITPNPLDASGLDSLFLHNGTLAPVTFDSLRFAATTYQYTAVGWDLFYEVEDAVGGFLSAGILYCPVAFPRTEAPSGSQLACLFGEKLFGTSVPAGGQIVFTKINIKCGQCLSLGGFDDTMFVYSGGLAVPDRVDIQDGGFVSSEIQPAGVQALSASPNPAASHVSLVLGEPSWIAVFDALGRQMHRASATDALRIDVSAWPPGVYVVRAEAPGRTETARFVVAR